MYTCSISVSPTPNSPWVAVGLQPGKLFRPKNNKLVYCLNSETKKVNHIFDAGGWDSNTNTHIHTSHARHRVYINYANITP